MVDDRAIMSLFKNKITVWVIIVSVIALLTSCQGSGKAAEEQRGIVSEVGDSEEGDNEAVAVDRIVFKTTEGELFLVNPDGSGEVKLAGVSQLQGGPLGAVMAQLLDENTFYSWPTWSPDGMKLAASLVEVKDGQPEISVQVVDVATGISSTVFQNEAPALIAEGTPHYLYWSPDSRTLAVLASTPQGLTLFAVDTGSLSEPTIIESGAPLYFHWAADGQSMLMHVADELKLLTRPFGASLAQPIEADPGFRTPALSPDGSKMAYLGEGGSVGSIAIAETGSPIEANSSIDAGPRAAFAWSPVSGDLAVADQQDLAAPTFDRLRVIPGDGGPTRTVADGRIIAFYWSPDGTKLAWAGLDGETRDFVWWSASAAGGQARELMRAQPSSDTLVTLSFFDQYAYSHSPWSPDSSRLVLSVVPGRSTHGRNGSSPPGPKIFVVDTDGAGEPLEVASGSLAFWSWN